MSNVNRDGNHVQTFFEQNAPTDPRRWVTASRAPRGPSDIMLEKKRVLYERTLTLPSSATAISVSTVELFGRRYISGIRILDGEGLSSSLGYVHRRNETLLSRVNRLPRIVGFYLAPNHQGIRGLAVLYDTGTLSAWAGDHKEIPERRLLSIFGGLGVVDCLQGKFDVSDSNRP
jgi:hypothetical protein